MKFNPINGNIFSLNKFLSYAKVISSIYGLSCFKYPSKSFKLSTFGTFMMIFNFAFNLYNFYTVALLMASFAEAQFEGTNKIVKLILRGTFLLSIMSSNIVILISFVLRKQIFEMMKKLEQLDKEIQSLKIFVNDFRDIGLLLILVSTKYVSILIMHINGYTRQRQILLFVSMQYTTIGIYVPLEIFIGILYLVKRRVHYVANALR